MTTLTSLIRLLGFGALALCAAAVGIGRIVQSPSASRQVRPGRPMALDGRLASDAKNAPHLVVPGADRPVRLPIPRGERLDHASGSPWQDPQGRRQVVGRFVAFAPGTQGMTDVRLGLARYTFPDGQPLDHVASEISPIAPPSWCPDASARVIFPAADGAIYRADFDSGDPRPRPLTWAVAPPGDGPPQIEEVAWPSIPRFDGRLLIAAMCCLDRSGQATRYRRPELWWLELDRAGTTIVGAGPLTRPDPAAPAVARPEERGPVVVAGTGGPPMLVYLAYEGGPMPGGWQLRAVPLTFEPRTGVPSAPLAEARILADGLLMVPPGVSADGRWLTCAGPGAGAEASLRRLAVPGAAGPAGALAGPDGRLDRPGPMLQ